MNNKIYQKVKEYYLSCRHYADETAAYPHAEWDSFVTRLYLTFEAIYTLDRESGEVTVRPGITDEELENLYRELKEAENRLRPLHNPEDDKIYLWKGENMPWHLLDAESWAQKSFDAPGFRPHVVKHLVNDGKKHPAVFVSGGRYRENLRGGRPVAEMLVEHGYNVFVLNDRHGGGLDVRKSMVRAMDLQRAIRVVRANAEELGVDREQIVTFGLSMGNRPTLDLINSLGIRTNPHEIDNSYISDEIDMESAKLNAYVSEYPATFPWQAPNNYADFPPVFGVMGNRDFSIWRVMPFFNDLIVNKVAVELHIYDGISHGFGMGDFKYYREQPYVQLQQAPAPYIQSVAEWPHLLFLWLERVLDKNYGYNWPIGQFDPKKTAR